MYALRSRQHIKKEILRCKKKCSALTQQQLIVSREKHCRKKRHAASPPIHHAPLHVNFNEFSSYLLWNCVLKSCGGSVPCLRHSHPLILRRPLFNPYPLSGQWRHLVHKLNFTDSMRSKGGEMRQVQKSEGRWKALDGVESNWIFVRTGCGFSEQAGAPLRRTQSWCDVTSLSFTPFPSTLRRSHSRLFRHRRLSPKQTTFNTAQKQLEARA